MATIVHPALLWLFVQTVAAKFNRLIAGLKSPRRLVVTVVAVVLGGVWLSQVVASVFLRAAADRGLLRERIALGLLGFLLFQILKIVFRKPVEPFEWTPCEIQILKTAPISRASLVIYRLATTAVSTVLKSLCLVLVMIPDLTFLAAGFIGMSMALLFLELVRVIAEVIIYSVGARRRLALKLGVAALVVAALALAVLTVLGQPGVELKLASPAGYQFLIAIALEWVGMTRAGFGAVLAFPFRLFSDIVLTATVNGQFICRVLIGLGFVGTAGFVAMVANCFMVKALQRQDRTNLERLSKASSGVELRVRRSKKRVSVPNHFCGAGPIAWRQLKSAWNYRGSIIVSFLIPTALCCVPMFAAAPPPNAALFLVASLLFYSYLLLPAALMLDFRRDVDRMAVLKKLPIRPMNVVIGQLAVPVILCSLFQAFVFLIAAFSGVATVGFIAVCWSAIVPMNVLIFASENIIFMLHPYRRNKEGADVLIRSVLTFTGKGVVWGFALAALLLWALGSSFLARQLGVSGDAYFVAVAAIFLTGTTTVVCLLAFFSLRCLSAMFDRFDPGVDSVAIN